MGGINIPIVKSQCLLIDKLYRHLTSERFIHSIIKRTEINSSLSCLWLESDKSWDVFGFDVKVKSGGDEIENFIEFNWLLANEWSEVACLRLKTF